MMSDVDLRDLPKFQNVPKFSSSRYKSMQFIVDDPVQFPTLIDEGSVLIVMKFIVISSINIFLTDIINVTYYFLIYLL